LLGMVADEERMKQYDQGPRSIVTANDDRSRGQAAQLATGANNQQNAATVQNAVNSAEREMVRVMSELITTMREIKDVFKSGLSFKSVGDLGKKIWEEDVKRREELKKPGN